MGELSEFTLGFRAFLTMYPWRRIDPVPWAPLQEPLARCRVALVSTAGFALPGQPPFDGAKRGGDTSFRLIPGDANLGTLREYQRSESFDHAGIREDPNLALPLDRLHELAARGRIGSVNRRHLSFMGSITAPGRLIRDSAPEAATLLVEDGVQAALLIPVWPMCNQTVGLVAAELERRRIATVVLQLLREVAKRVRPPRALFVPFRHGYPLDRPGNAERQHAVLEAAFGLLEDAYLEPPAPLQFRPAPESWGGRPMAFIPYGHPDDIPPEDRVPDHDNILRIHGVHSRAMRLHYDLYLELMRGPGPLSRVQREMIAVVVSATNGCHYWVEHHGAGLRALLRARGIENAEASATVTALARDYRMAELAASDRAMLDYALKLTRTPNEIASNDIEGLRGAGFDDRAIHDVCAITAYYAFVNRIADGLGVELELRFHR